MLLYALNAVKSAETNMFTPEQLREKLADIEHQRWADWQRYVHQCMGKKIDEDWFRLAPFYYERWQRQINTSYDKLTEKEKQSDREQVDRYWPLILEFVSQAIKDAVEGERKRIKSDLEYLTHYYRSKFSIDCSRGETEEEKTTEMLVEDDVIKILFHPHSKD